MCFLGFFTSGNSQNSILWTENQGSTSLPGKTYCATDLIGNIYMASSVNGTALDWVVASYRPDSVLRWTYTYSGTANLNDIVTGIVVDSSFNIYVVGTTEETSTDITLVKLDSAGTKIWAISYDSGGDDIDLSSGIAEFGQDIYLSGASYKAATGYNYRVVKYSKSGSLIWENEFNGNGNDDDFIADIDVDSIGSVYVTGRSTVTGGSFDILTLKYSSSGSLLWSKYFGMTPGQNDYGTALSTSEDGHVYVVGQSFISYTSDLVTIRYNASNGNQKWVARYNGTYNGMDYAADVIALTGAIYVVGSTEVGADNINFVTLCYNPGGKVKWMQIYNGPVSGNDECRTLLEDGDDIVVTGRSEGTKNYDVTTISYEKQHGTINWTIRYDAPFEEAEDVWSIARDEMGGLILGCYSQSGVFAYSPETTKILQKTKNDIFLEFGLSVITSGFQALSSDTVYKRVVWDNILRSVDSMYVINEVDLRKLLDIADVTTTSRINEGIANKYSLNSSFNWIAIFEMRFWNELGYAAPLMGVPLLYQFDKSGFVSSISEFGYSFNLIDFPIPCLSCGDQSLVADDMLGRSNFIFFVSIPAYAYYLPPGNIVKTITNCFRGASLSEPGICEVCPIIGIPDYVNQNNGGPGNHEIGIRLSLNDFGEVCGSIYDGNATQAPSPGDMTSSKYAVLSSLNGYYWRKVNTSTGTTLHKSVMPHISDRLGPHVPETSDRQHAYKMNLCGSQTLFHDYYESQGSQRFFLDFGGLYKIERPDILNMPPMYFYFSPFQNFTFTGGPDMNLNYNGSVTSTGCTSGHVSYSPDPSIENCLFASTFNSSFSVTNTEVYFANHDAGFLNNYWTDNVITVGFAGSSGGSVGGNYVEFFANNSPSVCDPLLAEDVGPLASILTCENSTTSDLGDGYETIEIFGSSSYPSGTRFLIHVEARFTNGETINQCSYFTTNNHALNYDRTTVMIRGGIEDYDPLLISYRVRVFETTP